MILKLYAMAFALHEKTSLLQYRLRQLHHQARETKNPHIDYTETRQLIREIRDRLNRMLEMLPPF